MSHHSGRAHASRLVVAVVALCALPLPAAAQRVVVSHAPQVFVGTPVIESWNLGTGRLEWQVPGLFGEAVLTADGRYLVAPRSNAGQAALMVIDAVSGSALTLPVAFAPIVAHPRAPAVFGLFRDATGLRASVARLDTSGLAVSGVCRPGNARHLDVSTDGGRLLVLCESGELAVLDAMSGAEIRRVPVAEGRQVASNVDGSRAVVIRGPDIKAGDIALVDTVTGASIATTVFPRPSTPVPPGDCLSGWLVGAAPDRSQIAIACSWSSRPPLGGPASYASHSRLLGIDGLTLTWGPDLGVSYAPRAIALSPDNTQAFSFSMHPRGFSVYQAIALPAATTTATFAPGFANGLAVAWAPLAPTLAVTVTGTTAALQWAVPAHSPAANGYVLEIGTGPGRSDLGTVSLGPTLALSVPGVPPGTYAVRLRGVNTVGPGAASNEVTVVVP